MNPDRRPRRRPSLLLQLTATVLAAVIGAASVRAQERSFDGWDAIGDEDYRFDPDSSEVATFAIQVSGEVRHRVQVAQDLMRAGDFRRAAEPLQELINLFPQHLFQVSETRWVGAAEYAKYLLSQFPPEGRVAYGEWAALRVGSGPRDLATGELPDFAHLRSLADRWVVTPPGLTALRVLGDLAQERGAHALAERYYRRRLLFEDLNAGAAADVALRAAAARVYQGHVGDALDLIAPYADDRVLLGGEEVGLREAIQDRLGPGAPPLPGGWPIIGGANDHAALATVPDDLSALGFARRSQWPVHTFSGTGRNPYKRSIGGDHEFPFHPVVAGGSLVLNDGLSVRAFSFFSPEPRWVFEGPLHDPRGTEDYYVLGDYVRDESSLGRDLPLSATIHDGIVLAPLMDRRPRGKDIHFEKTKITIAVPKRSLYAIDLATGEVLWRQQRPEQDEQAFVNRLSVPVPPVVVGDRVIASGYVLEGAISHYVACFSLTDGSLLWSTPIVVGQQELTMFNKTFKEFTPQIPAEADGSVYVCTNLGLVACLDTLTGNPRWVARYESIPIQGSLHYSRHRERETISNNDPPVVADGVVVVSPHDSYSFYAFEAATGKRLWERHSESRRGSTARYTWLLGVDDGMVVLGGLYALGFFDAKTGEERGSYTYDGKGNSPRGRGCIGPGTVFQPMFDRLLVLRWKRGPFGVEWDDELIPWDPERAGNLLVFEDLQVATSQDQMTVFFDIDSLVSEARTRAAAGSASLEDLIRLGDLESLRGDHEASVAAYARALEHQDLDPETRRRVHDGLHRGHRELARAAERVGDAETRRAHLFEEARYARDDHAFLRTAEQILALQEAARDSAGYLETLDWIDQRAAGADYAFAEHRYGGLVRAGVFTLERRALLALSEGRPADAVGAWQRMIERYPDLPFEGRTAERHARERIDETIVAHGAAVYVAFEREAAELHAAALRSKDRAALADLIARFPNSEHSVAYRLDLARLLLEVGDHGGVFEVVAPLLARDIGAAPRAQALELVARGAERAGDRRLAATVWHRLVETGTDLPVHGGEGASYASIAEEEIRRLDPEGQVLARGPRLRGRPVLQPRSFALDLRRDTNIVPVLEDGSGRGVGGVLVYGVERGDGAPRAWLRFIDTETVTERWRVPVDDYFHTSDPIQAYLIGGRLVLRQQRTLRGIAPEDGRLLFERELPGYPPFEAQGPGLLFASWDRIDGGSAVAAIEVASGSRFWERETGGEVADLVAGDDLVLVLTRDGRLTAFDGLTGATRYELSLLEISRNTEIAVFEEFGLLVATGGTEESRRPRLLAFDLRDGRRLWARDELPHKLSVAWLRPAQDRLLLLSGTTTVGEHQVQGIHAIEVMEPRSGRVLATLDVPPHLATFDRGPCVVGGRVVLVDEGRASRRRGPGRLVLVDLVGGATTDVPLDALPETMLDFAAFPTRDGDLCGTIDVRPTLPNSSVSYAFTLAVGTGKFELVRVASEHDEFSATPTTTPDSFVVLKDDRLFVYPVDAKAR